jgi:adenylyl-sulfate kinase
MDAAQGGFVVWITGMNGSGKSTLARYLRQQLAQAGRAVELIDGDDPAELLTRGLGVTKDERDAAVRRIGHVAKMLARNGVVALCASLSPYREARETLRREARRFVEVFVDCPMETLLARTPLYQKAMAGEVKNVPGVDDPYEPPSHAEITLQSGEEAVDAAARRVFQAFVDLKYLTPAEFGRVTGGQRPRRPPRARATPRKKLEARLATRKASKKAAARTTKAPRRASRR